MRPLEICLLAVNLPVLLQGIIAPRSRPFWLVAFPLVGAAVFAGHFLLEGWRWQMAPAYIVTVCLFLLSLKLLIRPAPPKPALRSLTMLADVFGLFLLGCANLLSILLPVFKFPAPTGSYRVGTVTMRLVDNSRPETLSKTPQSYRELMVQIWYPAEPSPGAAPDRYLSNLDCPDAAALKQKIYGSKLRQLDLVKTHAYPNAPLAAAKPRYPILIFSPAWSGARNQNTFQVEELASHGFIVVGIDHTYCSGVTVFPDGRIIYSGPDLDLDFKSAAGVQRHLTNADSQIQIRTQDARFVLDELEKMNAPDSRGPFADRLDTNRIGIFGHSFGGAVAAQACCLDQRFKAGLNMDGMLFRESARLPVAQPFMFMNSDEVRPTKEAMTRDAYVKMVGDSWQVQDDFLKRNGSYNLTISQSKHINFSDNALYSPLRRLTGAGRINARRCMAIVNAYSLAFFTQALDNTPAPLLAGPSTAYPEVTFEKFIKNPSQK
jgi:dienelactone hydrolase